MVDWIHLWEGGVEHMLRIQVHEDAHDSASNVANHRDEENLCIGVSGGERGSNTVHVLLRPYLSDKEPMKGETMN